MKRISLSFDNGPTPGVTEQVLATLRRHDVKATFFVVGSNLRDPRAAALLDAIAADGHWIGTHTLTHSVALGESDEPGYVEREIGEPQTMIGAHSHVEKLFRPYGNLGILGPHLFSEHAVDYLLAHKQTSVLWNSVPHDWDDPANWVDRLLADVDAQDWTVAVLHDIEGAAVLRLHELLTRLKAQHVEITQAFPDAVIATRAGAPVSLNDAYVMGRA
ncbi:polysaccharide deacetylase family protein [Caballeronia sp. LZ035]|uniref:polysaccharide deacetylase family protein n=1 Tax=Caballeronia sp. LZ035 TaxID=3038568 RepID=UPI002854F2F1|nr:polysaccharide deacetylase family protein [Caballeronia sp. LZ035]MDR5756317.1 polysaccharide deacetylase family protein [Caballeronia sp. LZ035]